MSGKRRSETPLIKEFRDFGIVLRTAQVGMLQHRFRLWAGWGIVIIGFPVFLLKSPISIISPCSKYLEIFGKMSRYGDSLER